MEMGPQANLHRLERKGEKKTRDVTLRVLVFIITK
jgi:hypothetical protein